VGAGHRGRRLHRLIVAPRCSASPQTGSPETGASPCSQPFGWLNARAGGKVNPLARRNRSRGVRNSRRGVRPIDCLRDCAFCPPGGSRLRAHVPAEGRRGCGRGLSLYAT
jgi:hypothetical protein